MLASLIRTSEHARGTGNAAQVLPNVTPGSWSALSDETGAGGPRRVMSFAITLGFALLVWTGIECAGEVSR